MDSGERKKRSAIVFNIKKAYGKINRKKTFEQLENMKIQERKLEFIKELITERWIKARVVGTTSQSKQTDLGIPQGVILSVILFLVAINGILGELGN